MFCIMGRRKGGDLAGIAQGAYDEAAAFGRFMAVVSLVVGCFIGSILIAGGLYLVFKKPVVDPKSKTEQNNSRMWMGAAMIIFGLLVMGGSIAYWYMITHFKMAAAATATGEIVGLADGAAETAF